MKAKSKIDQSQLRFEIRNMTYKSSLYRVLKEELSNLDYWKQRPRGKPNPNFIRR
jgi:hypothetical protein